MSTDTPYHRKQDNIMHVIPRQNFKIRFLHGIMNIILKLMQVQIYLCKLFPSTKILCADRSKGPNRTTDAIKLLSIFFILSYNLSVFLQFLSQEHRKIIIIHVSLNCKDNNIYVCLLNPIHRECKNRNDTVRDFNMNTEIDFIETFCF